jgi:hypothetical protein
MRQVFLTANFLKNGAANLPRSEFADKNVSHGQMRDQIVATQNLFDPSRP